MKDVHYTDYEMEMVNLHAGQICTVSQKNSPSPKNTFGNIFTRGEPV